MEDCFGRRGNGGAAVEDEEDELGTPSSSSSSAGSGDDDDLGSSSSEFAEDDDGEVAASLPDRQGDPFEMASLAAQLPPKTGLSKHFQGKSQSFTCLSAARCLEDLAKPERPQRKKMKPCRSYAGGLDGHNNLHSPKTCSRGISKKSSKGGSAAALSSLVVRRQGFLGGPRPPMPPHRSSSFSSQTLLFA
ncbi:unnamed protein product [Spirodela intermedia]|uniref:Uncharacterized protein n=1 Tax=Spirodela intermedia TaxID=51605 RepID=A0A7I8KP16_SPIIN|nr:unnamed protein product [Spirodela intermedia]